MWLEATIGGHGWVRGSDERRELQLTLTRDSRFPSCVILRFGDLCYGLPIEELKDALYYFHEEMHR